MTIADWAGAIGGGDDFGVGAALDVNIVTEDDQAYIAPNATVDAAQNVAVAASTNGAFQSTTAALALGGSAAMAGAASIEVIFADDERVHCHRRDGRRRRGLAGPGEPPGDDRHACRPVGRKRRRQRRRSGLDGRRYREHRMRTLASNDQITAQGTSGTVLVLSGNSAGGTTPFSGVAVVAATFQNVQTIVVGGEVSSSAGVAGSASVNVLSDTTLAYIAERGDRRSRATARRAAARA